MSPSSTIQDSNYHIDNHQPTDSPVQCGYSRAGSADTIKTMLGWGQKNVRAGFKMITRRNCGLDLLDNSKNVRDGILIILSCVMLTRSVYS